MDEGEKWSKRMSQGGYVATWQHKTSCNKERLYNPTKDSFYLQVQVLVQDREAIEEEIALVYFLGWLANKENINKIWKEHATLTQDFALIT